MILTLSHPNLFKEIIKKRNLKHNQTSEKQIDISFIFSPLQFNNRSCRGVRKLVIPVGITWSERVNIISNNYFHNHMRKDCSNNVKKLTCSEGLTAM